MRSGWKGMMRWRRVSRLLADDVMVSIYGHGIVISKDV